MRPPDIPPPFSRMNAHWMAYWYHLGAPERLRFVRLLSARVGLLHTGPVMLQTRCRKLVYAAAS